MKATALQTLKAMITSSPWHARQYGRADLSKLSPAVIRWIINGFCQGATRRELRELQTLESAILS